MQRALRAKAPVCGGFGADPRKGAAPRQSKRRETYNLRRSRWPQHHPYRQGGETAIRTVVCRTVTGNTQN